MNNNDDYKWSQSDDKKVWIVDAGDLVITSTSSVPVMPEYKRYNRIQELQTGFDRRKLYDAIDKDENNPL